MLDLDLRELRIFQSVVEENGFQRAADVIHISQSAVSQALARLEQKLGATLINRTSPLTLTEAGQRLLAFTRTALNGEEALFDDLERIRSGAGATLSIAINAYIQHYHGDTLLKTFFKVAPAADIRIEVLPSRQIIYAVDSGRWELGLGPFQTEMSAFERVPLFTESRQLVVGKRLMKVMEKQPIRKALLDIPLIASYLDRPDQRPDAGRIRARFRTVWQVNQHDLRLHLVRQGHGATFVERAVLQDKREGRSLVPLTDLPYSEIRRDVGIYFRKDASLSSAAEQFIRICREHWRE